MDAISQSLSIILLLITFYTPQLINYNDSIMPLSLLIIASLFSIYNYNGLHVSGRCLDGHSFFFTLKVTSKKLVSTLTIHPGGPFLFICPNPQMDCSLTLKSLYLFFFSSLLSIIPFLYLHRLLFFIPCISASN